MKTGVKEDEDARDYFLRVSSADVKFNRLAFVEINCIESSAKPLNINGRREKDGHGFCGKKIVNSR